MKTIPGVDSLAAQELFSRDGPLASAYFDLRAIGEQDAFPRWRAVAEQLEHEGAAPETVEALTERVMGAVPGPGVLAAFAEGDDVFYTRDLAGSNQPDLGTYRHLPHVVPLLSWSQDHPAYVVAVVDRIGADISAYARGSDSPTSDVVTGPDDVIERNAPGGWAQPRYQRRAEDSWAHNAKQVADVLAERIHRVDARLLLLAGDVRALHHLDQHLPTWVHHDVVIRRVTGGRSPDGSWPRRAEQARWEVRQAAADDRARLLAELLADQARGRAVQGVRGTVAALARAQVRTLLLSPAALDGRVAWFGPEATDVALRRDHLLRARAPARRAPLVDVAIRAALLTDADVIVLEPAAPAGPSEGIGALCRFHV